jgi:hypothetical protein
MISNLLGVTQLHFSNRQVTEYAKIFSMTPRFLGDLDNSLGELGSLAVQMCKSFVYYLDAQMIEKFNLKLF